MSVVLDNNVLTTLASDVAIGATTISVAAATSPRVTPPDPSGATAVLSLSDSLTSMTKYEIITYTGRTGTGPYTLTGVSKGQEGTADQAWSSGEFVYQSVTEDVIATASGTTSPLTTKGDLYTYSSDNARLAIGTNDYFLLADSAETTGLKWAQPAHSLMGSLTSDDHSQYALLNGRSGGQTLKGGTAASDGLTLNSTSNATKGKIFFGSDSAFNEANGYLGIGTTSPGVILDVSKNTNSGSFGTYPSIRAQNPSTATHSFSQVKVSANNTGVEGHILADGLGTGSLGTAGVSIGTITNHPIGIFTNASERVRITSTGNVGIGTTSPSAKLDINSDTIRLRTSKTPSSASDTGNQGDIAWDSNYIYICIATNTWQRAAHATW